MDYTNAKKVLQKENEQLQKEIDERLKKIHSNDLAIDYMTILEQKSKKEETK